MNQPTFQKNKPMSSLIRRTLLAKNSRFYSNISTVTPFTQIEGRWSKLPKAEQGALADQLAELQKGDWKNMSMEQKRAGKNETLLSHFLAYYIAYGSYGPRTPRDPSLNYRVFGWVAGLATIAFLIWKKSSDCNH